MLKLKSVLGALAGALCLATLPASAQKPPLTLDEFFEWVEVRSVQISPDGGAVAIETQRPDWKSNRYRRDLWLYEERGGKSGELVPLTHSGHDSAPQWSPDGRWIAFVSDRDTPGADDKETAGSSSAGKDKKPRKQIYVIGRGGGEAFPVIESEEEVHAFAWSADSGAIYFATRTPWTKQQKEDWAKNWNDVIRYRESERGDAIARVAFRGTSRAKSPDNAAGTEVSTTPYRVKELAASPDGRWLAFSTEPPSERHESLEPYAIYLAELAAGRVTRANTGQTLPLRLNWARDSRHLFFAVEQGSVEGQYEEIQQRVYWLDPAEASRAAERWGAGFGGSLNSYAVTREDGIVVAGGLGTEVEPYTQSSPAAEFARRPGWPGTYERPSTGARSSRVAFVYSSLESPTEVYLAESADGFERARPITAFNRLLRERELPKGKPFRWVSEGGTPVEGMLIYPPGKFGAKNLPTFTFIHGGPPEADGNYFEADWYKWGVLAAAQGWLVFEPNYHGSTGYGDAFARDVIIHLVSRPGKEILDGLDALVREGIADPNRLTIGGYSYGGYLTNWLITQTTRFKAAVSGAGAVEHVVNWGNDDTTYEDSYYMGGPPWQAQQNYNDEAAIWQINKVRTPTHIVAGAVDVRVYVGEAYLLERALHTLGVPTSLVIFPGEGHGLDKNPWHAKIKVREELKWVEKYGGQ